MVRCRSKSALLAAAALPLLAACAVGPNFAPPESPPIGQYLPGKSAAADRVPGRQIVRGEPVPERWWTAFHSPTLDALIAQAIDNNAELKAAEAAVRVAQANALAQRGTLFPLVNGQFNASRQLTPDQTLTTNAASGASVYSLYTPQVTVSFVPDVWGGQRRQLESVEAVAEMQAFQREAVYLTLAANVALAAIEEGRLQAQIAAAARIAATQADLLGILRRQFEQGQIAGPDVAAQETALAQSRLLLPPLQKQLAQQQHLLAFLSGTFPATFNRPPFRLASFRVPRRLPLTLPADLVRQRPDVRAAEATLHSANAQIGTAIANRLPQIAMTGNAGSTATAVSQLFAPGTGFWTIAANATQTIFDAGTLAYKQRAAEENTREAFEQYRGVVLTAVQNVANVLAALKSDARAIASASAAEKAAQNNLDLTKKLLAQGQISTPLLLSAQQAYLQTTIARIDAQAALLADTVALFQALGGGAISQFPAADARRVPE